MHYAGNAVKPGRTNNATQIPAVGAACIDQYFVLQFTIDMDTVTVSPKFQVVIPRSVRREMALRPGEKLRVLRHGNRIELIPVRPIREMRGLLRGMDTNIEREEDRL